MSTLKKIWKNFKRSFKTSSSKSEKEALRTLAVDGACDGNIIAKALSSAPAGAMHITQGDGHRAGKPLGACPAYAAKSVVGQRMTMEDSWQAVPDLLAVPKWWTCNARERLPIPPPARQPEVTGEAIQGRQDGQTKLSAGPSSASAGPSVASVVSAPAATTAATSAGSAPSDPRQLAAVHGTEPISVHFFAVYDGHGGPDVAKHCAKSLHEHLKTVVVASLQGNGPAPQTEAPAGPPPTSLPESTSNAPAQESKAVEVWPPRVDGIEAAIRSSFLHTDSQLAEARSAHEVGTTAVVSLVTAHHLWVGNCGDSRALLCRENEAVALSLDHKATRVDEVSRVEQAGGYVWWDRVMGELAVSRAIGDHCLRPFVIAEPEITTVQRRPTDQLLVMASDGLWDVFTNEEACTLALEKFNGELLKTSSSKMAVRKAASSLAKAALAKGSRDNVTVVVVDVRHGAGARAVQPALQVASPVTPTGSDTEE